MLTPEQKAILLKSNNFREASGIAPKSSETLSSTFDDTNVKSQFENLRSSVKPVESVTAPVAEPAPEPEVGFLERFGGKDSFFGKIGTFSKEATEDTIRTLIGLGISGKNAAEDIDKFMNAERDENGKILTETDRSVDLPILGKTEPFFTGKEKLPEFAGKVIEGGVVIGGSLEGAKGLPSVKKGVADLLTEGKKAGAEVIGAVKEGGEALLKKSGIKTAKEKIESQAAKSITPDVAGITSKEYVKLAEQGRITPKKGIFDPQTYILSEDEIALTKKYATMLQENEPIKNLNSIKSNLTANYNKTKPLVKEANAVVDRNKLTDNMIKELTAVAKKDMNISEDAIVDMVESFQKFLKEGDLVELFENRNAFTTGKTFEGLTTTQKTLDKAARRGIKQTLEDALPSDYKPLMDEMSDMYEIADLLDYTVKAEKGKSALKLWLKNNPAKSKIVGYGASGLGVGFGGAAIYDIFKSVGD